MHESLTQHAADNFAITTHALGFGDGPTGSNRLRRAVATFLTEKLHSVTPIMPDHITVTNGCNASIENLAWALSNPGDGVLLGRPYFGGFVSLVGGRMGVKVITVPFAGVDPLGIDAVEIYETTLARSKEQGQPIAALLICNPHNPTSRCYTREALVGLMRLCEKYKIHLVSDELYALSTWPNSVDTHPAPVPFFSCLSIDPTGIIDPSRLHVVWGISKDLGANGLRIGVIVSQHNPSLHAALMSVALLSSSSSAADHIAANVLEDTRWIEKYLAENRRLLAENYSLVAEWAKSNKIEYAPGASAAFFLWINFGRAYHERHAVVDPDTAEKSFNELFLKHKVFVTPGSQYGSEEPGWFRLTFAHPQPVLREGLRRILRALEDNVRGADITCLEK